MFDYYGREKKHELTREVPSQLRGVVRLYSSSNELSLVRLILT